METKKKKIPCQPYSRPKVWLLIVPGGHAGLVSAVYHPPDLRGFPNMIVTIKGTYHHDPAGRVFQRYRQQLDLRVRRYALGFVIALPVAILMAWYMPVRNVIEPWIQFIRNIPPLAYVPLIVIVAGVGRQSQIIVITIACFLIMCVTIYQGVINVDETLIKAARVLGARR